MFVKKELKPLETIVMPKVLGHEGFNSHISMAVTFSSKHFLGLGCYNLKAFHLAAQVEILIKHFWAQVNVGLTAHIMLQWAQLNAGINFQYLKITEDFHT